MTTVYAHVPAQALIVRISLLSQQEKKRYGEIRVLIFFGTSHSLLILLESW